MPLAPTIKFEFKDSDGDAASSAIHVQPGMTIAQYGAFAQFYASFLDPITLGAVQPRAFMQFPVDISALTDNTTLATSDVEQVASFQFADANNEPVDINIPGNLVSNILTGSDGIDTAGTEIAAFIALIEAGNGTIAPCAVSESDILSLFYARKITRASGRKRR